MRITTTIGLPASRTASTANLRVAFQAAVRTLLGRGTRSYTIAGGTPAVPVAFLVADLDTIERDATAASAGAWRQRRHGRS